MNADELAAVVLDQAEREGIEPVTLMSAMVDLMRLQWRAQVIVATGSGLDALVGHVVVRPGYVSVGQRRHRNGRIETDAELRDRVLSDLDGLNPPLKSEPGTYQTDVANRGRAMAEESMSNHQLEALIQNAKKPAQP